MAVPANRFCSSHLAQRQLVVACDCVGPGTALLVQQQHALPAGVCCAAPCLKHLPRRVYYATGLLLFNQNYADQSSMPSVREATS